jgi:hypothetical protein
MNTYLAQKKRRNHLATPYRAFVDYVILLRTFQRARRFLLPIFRLRLDLAIHISCV